MTSYLEGVVAGVEGLCEPGGGDPESVHPVVQLVEEVRVRRVHAVLERLKSPTKFTIAEVQVLLVGSGQVQANINYSRNLTVALQLTVFDPVEVYVLYTRKYG